MPLGIHDPGLGLSIEGITGCDEPESLVYVDAHHELMVKSTGQAHVVIERSGRKIVLRPEHPIRILSKDTIIIGSTDKHTFCIRHIYSTRKTTQSNRTSKMAMIACAASMMMVSAACQHPAPNNATQSNEPAESQATELTEEDMQLMKPSTTTGIVPADMDEMEKLLKDKPDFVDEMKSDVVEE